MKPSHMKCYGKIITTIFGLHKKKYFIYRFTYQSIKVVLSFTKVMSNTLSFYKTKLNYLFFSFNKRMRFLGRTQNCEKDLSSVSITQWYLHDVKLIFISSLHCHVKVRINILINNTVFIQTQSKIFHFQIHAF